MRKRQFDLAYGSSNKAIKENEQDIYSFLYLQVPFLYVNMVQRTKLVLFLQANKF